MSNLYGVDTAAGLKMLGGNSKIYLRLLQTYQEGDLYQNLADAVDDGDVDRAQVAAHTLKGATGNLHLEELYQKSKEVEGRIKETHTLPTREAMSELGFIQARTLSTIQRLLDNPSLMD